MKFYIISVILSMMATTISIAQSKHQKTIQKSLKNKSVEISLDTVFYSGEAWFTLSAKGVNNIYYNTKEVKNLKNLLVATISKTSVGAYGMAGLFSIEFPSITNKASVTKSSYETCMQTLFDNHVFKNKELNSETAKQFVTTHAYVAPIVDTSSTNQASSQNANVSSNNSNFIHAKLCGTCGFGNKKDNCVKCNQWTGGGSSGISAKLCAACGQGTNKDNCVKCGKWTGNMNTVDAKLCNGCGLGSKKDNCAKCGQWAP